MGKDLGFTLLRVVALHDAHAGERFGKAARHLGVDFPALAENRPDHPEGAIERSRERGEYNQGQNGQRNADMKKDDQGKERREDAAGELHETGPNQVPQALDVAHDAGDKHARLRRVVIGHGEPPHVFLDLPAQLGDEPLRLFREQLRQREIRNALNGRRAEHYQHQRYQQRRLPLDNDIVHEEF